VKRREIKKEIEEEKEEEEKEEKEKKEYQINLLTR